MFLLAKDPAVNPFSDWLKVNGIYVAIGVAIALVIIISVLFILSKIKKD